MTCVAHKLTECYWESQVLPIHIHPLCPSFFTGTKVLPPLHMYLSTNKFFLSTADGPTPRPNKRFQGCQHLPRKKSSLRWWFSPWSINNSSFLAHAGKALNELVSGYCFGKIFHLQRRPGPPQVSDQTRVLFIFMCENSILFAEKRVCWLVNHENRSMIGYDWSEVHINKMTIPGLTGALLAAIAVRLQSWSTHITDVGD